MSHPDRLQQLWRRDMPPDYLREAADRYAAPIEKKHAADRSALAFRIGAEWLALPTSRVDEVVEPRAHHSLPQRRSGALLGVVNVRGELLACVSLAVLLDIAAGAPAARGARLLVLRQGRRRLACPVDEVDRIVRYGTQDLGLVPATLGASGSFTRALLQQPERTVGLLDDESLLRAVERSLA